MRHLIIMLALCAYFPCRAQSQKNSLIDSSYRHLQKSTGQKDTVYLKALNNYARIIRHDSNTKALLYAEQAIVIAKKIKDEYWLAQGYATAGMVYNEKGDLQNGINYFDSAIVLFEQQKRFDILSGLLGTKGGLLVGQGKYADAVDMQLRSIELGEKTGNLSEQAKGYGDIAILFFNIGMHTESLKEFTSALARFKQLKDSASIALCYEYIGHNYVSLRNYTDARAAFDTSIFFYSAINRSNNVSSVKGSMAITMAYMGEVRKALELEKNTLKQAIASDRKSLISMSYSKVAKVILLGLDSIKNNEFSLTAAIEHAEKGLEIAKTTGRVFGQTYAMEILAELYQRKGDYVKAYGVQKDFSRIKDSLANSNKIHEVAIKTAQFENQKEQAVLMTTHAAQLRQQKMVRYFLVSGGILALLSASIIFWFYSRRRDARTRQQEAELKAQMAETENKILRLQMNPHFIFNSLNSISDYVRNNDIEEADAYLASFATAMRLSLENSERKEISLTEDIRALELYLQLEARRLRNKFTYSVTMAEDIDPHNTMVPPMLLQPIVENSIWHGIAKKQGSGHIAVSFSKEGDCLNCKVEDNGIGRTSESYISPVTGKKSLGMKITRTRIEILNKQKGTSASLSVTDKPDGLITIIKLPFQTTF